ncbi:MAG: hypothetical protein V4792_19140 [Pseudomonadota bacterium]
MRTFILYTAAVLFTSSAAAQSTVGELLDKGAKKILKEDYLAMMPMRLQYQWPNRQGEGDLVFRADGSLSGSEYHYASRSESPATGTHELEDDGKWCMKKHMPVWNSRTDQCWHNYKLGDDYYGAFSDDKGARAIKVKSVSRVQ